MTSETNYKPFTYLIGWSQYQKYYYGARYAKNCNPSDLWTIYFTSSFGPETSLGHSVESFRKSYGEPDIIKIRKIFIDADSCVKWERRVLKRLKAKSNSKFINKNEGSYPYRDTTGFALAKLKETLEIIGLVSKDDPRWYSGEIVGAAYGSHPKKPKSFGDAVSKRLKGVKKNKTHIDNKRKTVTKIQDDGYSIAQKAAKKAINTKLSTKIGDKNMLQIASEKSTETRTKIQDDGYSIAQKAGLKGAITKTKIQDDGYSIAQKAAKKRKLTVSDEQNKEYAQKSAATMKIPDIYGKTIYEKAAEKQKLTRLAKSRKFNIMHISGECIYSNVTLNFVRNLSPSLHKKTTPETAIGIGKGKGSSIVQRFINQNKSHLLGLYVIEL